MNQKIEVGKRFDFRCDDCGEPLDRKGKVCCECYLFNHINGIEKQKAELRAITEMVKSEEPKLLNQLKLKAREMAIEKVFGDYGLKIK